MSLLRLFIAVDLPPDLRLAVAKLCQGIEGARWTRPEQLHITLRFLGDTPEEQLADLRPKLRRVAVSGFSLALTGPGVFPPLGGRKPAHVLWLGLNPPAPVQALKQAIDAVLGPDPEAAQRGFSPHLTLARLGKGEPRSRRDLDAFLAKHADLAAGPFPVSGFHLYRSTLRPQGALHEVVETYPLLG
jgi:RNA 2',3'-cyclic 3'-phosphodiesterase